MSSRRRALLIALAVAAIGLGALASWHFYSRPMTVPEKFVRIKVGMTRQEVVAILGPPTLAAVGSRPGLLLAETWESGRWGLMVIFEKETVIDREFIEGDDPFWVWLMQARRQLGL